MSESTTYVTYYVAPQQKGGLRSNFGEPEVSDLSAREQAQRQAVQDYLAERNPQGQLCDSFVEMPDNRRTVRWPELQKALESCKRNQATLLIVELGTLTSNENFTQSLLESGVKFHCLDQPFVNQTILEALSKHAQVQRKLHGKLIREGLKMTSAKSGNPNAAEVISKVNKPKIDTAIVFAFLLQPIIQDYRRKGYSQRQMVKTLNDEGFTAPEGGKWVLSQLQKVLDRVRLNEIALEAKSILATLPKEATQLTIAESLNAKAIGSPKRGPWDEPQVKKLQDRIQQIQDIVHINQFVLDLLSVVHEYRNHGSDCAEILNHCHLIGISIRHDIRNDMRAEMNSEPHSHAHGHSQTHIQAAFSNKEQLRQLLEKLKHCMMSLPAESAHLDLALESAAKHIPAYLKIVKGHIDQLAKVLELETHENRKIESVGLAQPVTQLMQLFRELNDQDLQMLETLSFEARHWQEEREGVVAAMEKTAVASV